MKISQLITFTPLPANEAPRVAPRLSQMQAMAIARVLDNISILTIGDLLFEDEDMIEAYFEGEAILEEMARS